MTPLIDIGNKEEDSHFQGVGMYMWTVRENDSFNFGYIDSKVQMDTPLMDAWKTAEM